MSVGGSVHLRSSDLGPLRGAAITGAGPSTLRRSDPLKPKRTTAVWTMEGTSGLTVAAARSSSSSNQSQHCGEAHPPR